MNRYNLIIVIDKDFKNVLLCKKTKKIYAGYYNFVGGHIEEGESDEASAYRELFEETNIREHDIRLKLLADFIYPISNVELVVYVGKLINNVKLVEEENPLFWFDINSNFFADIFAGEGNVGHLIEQVKIHENKLFPNYNI